jgi:hypothetical protein
VVVRSLGLNHLLKRFNFLLLPLCAAAFSGLKSPVPRECMRALSLIFVVRRRERDALNEEPFTHNAAPHLFSLLQEAGALVVFAPLCFSAGTLGSNFLCVDRLRKFGTDTKEPILRNAA